MNVRFSIFIALRQYNKMGASGQWKVCLLIVSRPNIRPILGSRSRSGGLLGVCSDNQHYTHPFKIFFFLSRGRKTSEGIWMAEAHSMQLC